jgi:hypothetical protein
MGPIDKLKTIGIVVLLIFTFICGSSTVWLIKANTALHTEIGVMQLKLDESKAAIETFQDAAKVDNEALAKQIESGIILENQFTSLDEQLAEIKCKSNQPVETTPNVNKTIQQGQVSRPTTVKGTDAADIANVGRLLDQAACTANSDCKPSDGSPSRL